MKDSSGSSGGVDIVGDGSLLSIFGFPRSCYMFIEGDSSTEPYLVTHHQILAHAAAVKVYRDKYQISQKGQIGITLNSPWIMPLSQSKEDINAAFRAIVFLYDW
ncbi:hypothetical protein V8G54_024613 [Vigna mungo]|uniref:Beta-glucosidase n=1 Tax=Vigna mungo TaxID=3915 RepID=A0AAQ3N6L7_VIGMU